MLNGYIFIFKIYYVSVYFVFLFHFVSNKYMINRMCACMHRIALYNIHTLERSSSMEKTTYAHNNLWVTKKKKKRKTRSYNCNRNQPTNQHTTHTQIHTKIITTNFNIIFDSFPFSWSFFFFFAFSLSFIVFFCFLPSSVSQIFFFLSLCSITSK